MHKWHYHPEIEALRLVGQSGEIGTIEEVFTVRHAWVNDFHGGDVFWPQAVYEWQEGDSQHFITTLRKLEGLRKRIDAEGSRQRTARASLPEEPEEAGYRRGYVCRNQLLWIDLRVSYQRQLLQAERRMGNHAEEKCPDRPLYVVQVPGCFSSRMQDCEEDHHAELPTPAQKTLAGAGTGR